MPSSDERIALLEEFVVVEPMTVEDCLDWAERSPRLAGFWLSMAKMRLHLVDEGGDDA